MKDKHTMGSPATSVESLSQASLYESIRTLLLASRTQVRQTVNTAMVQTYWHIGRMIVEDEAALTINKEAAPPRKRQPDAGLDFVLRAQCSGGQVFAAG